MKRLPVHLRRPLLPIEDCTYTDSVIKKYHLNTVCSESKCPNRMECYRNRTATFLALGNQCTRSCSFCNIGFSKNPAPPQADEPERIACSVQELQLEHAVITMVTRDDLPDQGAGHIAAIIRFIRQKNPHTTVEVLTSDFSGNFSLLDIVLNEQPEIFNHNLETVRSLTPRVRHKAEYDRSLAVLKHAHESSSLKVKSGLMLGLGETDEEVRDSIRDLAQAGCDIITIGQYLQPSKRNMQVCEFIPPERFREYEEFGYSLGLSQVYCGPWVRSDYNADLMMRRSS